MTTNDDAPQRSTRAMCEKMVHTVIDLFVDHLLHAAKEDDHIHIDPQELLYLARDFKSKRKRKYLGHTRKIAENWLHHIQHEYWDHARIHPFERVLVKRFSHLFPPAETLQHKHAVSRRVLPGLFAAFEQLAGHEFLHQCQGASRAILRARKEEAGDGFKWEDVYGHHGVNDLVDDLLIVVAWSFQDINVRLKWLLELINNNLAPPEDYAFEGEEVFKWTLREEGLLEILRALFSNFADKFANAQSLPQFEQRYGQRACDTLRDVLDTLDVG